MSSHWVSWKFESQRGDGSYAKFRLRSCGWDKTRQNEEPYPSLRTGFDLACLKPAL